MFVGVFGEDESCKDSGESSTNSIGSGPRSVLPDTDRFGATDVAADRGLRSLFAVSSSAVS